MAKRARGRTSSRIATVAKPVVVRLSKRAGWRGLSTDRSGIFHRGPRRTRGYPPPDPRSDASAFSAATLTIAAIQNMIGRSKYVRK